MTIEELGNFTPDGRIIHATFLSRKDSTIHSVIGRVGVHRYVSGEGLKFNPTKKGLLGVYSWDRDEKGRFIGKGYRFIPAESIISIKSDGVTYNNNGNVISDDRTN